MTVDLHSAFATHEVTNQPRPEPQRDLWHMDRALQCAARWAGADAGVLAGAGARLGGADMFGHAQAARRDSPRLKQFDRTGRRCDEVEFHPGYHALMQTGLELGYAAHAWEGHLGGHATHAVMVYYMAQVEPGVSCPLTMTYAAVPALVGSSLATTWVPKLTARDYDPSIAPVERKRAVTMGMAMTEKQGGSDVRANTTTATPHGDHYTLRGHKWFCSAPMSDAFLTLAQAPGGLTCFLVPRWLETGRNTLHLMRLKDKLGNTANASSEIEYHDAVAFRLGDEGQGVKTIIEMVHHTRLDTAMAPAGLMRAALAQAHWWVSHRSAFQRHLIDQPLMRAVMADLTLEADASLALGMGAARAYDGTTEADRAFARISVALAKFISNKRAPVMIVEAMECLGGMGYVEETPMPMLYREAPLNGIWEGSGNVICLDILRSLAREPLAGETLMARLTANTGCDARFDAALRTHQDRWPGLPPEAKARWFAESAANLLASAYLLEMDETAVAEGFIATRLGGNRGHVPGAISGVNVDAVLARLQTHEDRS